MIQWRLLDIGDKVMWNVNDFDGKQTVESTVNEVHNDHVIVNAEGMALWLDDFNADEFFPIMGEYRINGTHYTYDPKEHDVHFYCDRSANIRWVCIADCERDCPRYSVCQYIYEADDALKLIECEA